jgi:hypothetical protein
MVLYFTDIPIKNPIINDILPLIILFIIITMPFMLYFTKINPYLTDITLIMASFLFLIQCVALYYNFMKYPL